MKDQKNLFVHFWQSYEQGNLQLFFKLNGWTFKDAILISGRNAAVRFATVGGYDHNNCYAEHNNWEGLAPAVDPMTTATKIFQQHCTVEELINVINQYDFTISRFAYEDSNGCFFTGQDNGEEIMFQITVPGNELKNFVERLLSVLPVLQPYLNHEQEMRAWIILNNGVKVASLYVNESVDEYKNEKLRPILESLEGVFLFIR